MAVYFVIIFLTSIFGSLQIASSTQFAMIHRYDVLTSEAVEESMVSAHYESMRTEHDRLLRYPMIPSDRISEVHLRLFLPHQPRRDNALARETCRGLQDGRNAGKQQAATALAHACLGSFWTITLDGEAVALDDFVPIERRDLDLRGLVGYLPSPTCFPADTTSRSRGTRTAARRSPARASTASRSGSRPRSTRAREAVAAMATVAFPRPDSPLRNSFCQQCIDLFDQLRHGLFRIPLRTYASSPALSTRNNCGTADTP